MKSLSVGERSVFSEVNWRSKLETSLRWRCKRDNERGGTVGLSKQRDLIMDASNIDLSSGRSLHMDNVLNGFQRGRKIRCLVVAEMSKCLE